MGPEELGVSPRDNHLDVAAHGARAVGGILLTRLVGRLQRDGPVLAVEPGVVFLGPVEVPRGSVVAAARAQGPPVQGRPVVSTSLVGLWEAPSWVTEVWEEGLRVGEPDTWLDGVAALLRDTVLLPRTTLASAWSIGPTNEVNATSAGLRLDGDPVLAVDLHRMDFRRPWLLDADGRGTTRLSQHPDLARLVASLVEAVPIGDSTPAPENLERTSLGTQVEGPIRHLVREALDAGQEVPDPFALDEQDALRAWLTEPHPDHDGVPRYLAGVHATRADLQAAFPDLLGADADRLHAWAQHHGAAEGFSATLLAAPLRRRPAAPRPTGRPRPGVTVAGFLGGGMGLSESARLLVTALEAAGVPHAEYAVHGYARTGGTSSPSPAPPAHPFDTTLLCVNADLTPAVAASLPRDIARAYRIGMWYWEVEDFPVSQHGGFAAVDEVWVATDFVARAIGPHSPVPVRTLTPPLPQRGPDPTVTAADLGLTDRPYLLFTFDFLSTAERKNPWGLVEAYRRAFEPGEGPQLVIKSINAAERPADAERLRLAAAQHPDVVLVERYLPGPERDALVAHCLAYVSLHRSEGLGLTMAEAMAWGKPVVATGYSGNLAFMTEENSYLVPWRAVAIPDDAPPYPAGTVWADPDLDAAAALLRRVVDEPAEAAARGARAAHDIATLHGAAAAGRALAARLAELAPARRAKMRRDRVRAVRRLAGALRDAVH